MNGAQGRKGRGRKPKTNKRKRGAARPRRGGPNGPNPNSAVSQVRMPRKRNGKSRRGQGRRLKDFNSVGGAANSTSRLGGRTCRIQEDEYIGEIVGPGTGANFNNVAYPINPGQVGTFPWLSKIAAQWEKYHFNRLEFYYKPEVTGFATAGQSGKVIMSIDFDASDAPPASKQQMEDTIPHADGMPSVQTRLPLAASQLHALYQTLYVRPAGLPGASDIKTYDAGNFNIATQGLNSNSATLGELRVKYDVTLSVPVLESATTAPANNSVVVLQSASGGEALTTATPLNLALAGTQIGSLGVTNTSGSLVFPAGNYMWESYVRYNATVGLSACSLNLQKAAASINIKSPAFTDAGGGTVTDFSLSNSGFFTSDGTSAVSAITMVANGTFGSGNCTAWGELTVLAV